MSYQGCRRNVVVRPMSADESALVKTCEEAGCVRPATVWVDYDVRVLTPRGVKTLPALGRGCCAPCAKLLEARAAEAGACADVTRR